MSPAASPFPDVRVLMLDADVGGHLGRALRPDPAVLEPLRRLAGQHLLAAVSSSADPGGFTAALTGPFAAARAG